MTYSITADIGDGVTEWFTRVCYKNENNSYKCMENCGTREARQTHEICECKLYENLWKFCTSYTQYNGLCLMSCIK